MKLNDISYKIRGAIFNVYNALGPGLLESVYQEAMRVELQEMGLRAEKEVPIDVDYKGKTLNLGFRIDLLIENEVILELKSVETIQPVHKKQLQTYLRLTGKQLGFLVIFNCTDLKSNIIRAVNNFKEENASRRSRR